MSTDNNELLDSAKDFWRLSGADTIAHCYAYNALLELQEKYGRNDYKAYKAESTTLMGNLFGTDMDSISQQFNAGLDSELGYWSGTYILFDEKGIRYNLTVGQDDAILMLPASAVETNQEKSAEDRIKEMKLSNSTYSQGLLKLSSEHYTFELRFKLPHQTSDLENALKDDKVKIEKFFQETQPLCEGIVGITQEGKTHQLKVKGKRGSYTQAGVEQAGDGDPISTWLGEYTLLDATREGSPQPSTDLVKIFLDEDGIQFQWGENIFGKNIQFNNNVLLCTDEEDTPSQYALKFSCTQDNHKQLIMAVAKEGFVAVEEEANHHFIGFWQGNPNAVLAPIHADKRRLLTPSFLATSALGGANTSETLYEREFNWDASPTDSIKLPAGVPSNPYRLKLTLGNGQANATYSWALDEKFQAKGSITPEVGATTSAILQIQWLASDVGDQSIAVTLKLSDGSSKTFNFSITVQSLPVITISPTTLTIYRGNSVKISFSANGGDGNLIWKEIVTNNTKLPSGLNFDPGTQELTGIIGDTSAAFDLYALSLEVSTVSENVLMTPGHFTIPIQVLEPGQVAAEKTGYALIALTVLGSLFGAVAFVKNCHDWRKSNEKNAGDPTFEKPYKRLKLIGDSLKTSLDGLSAKRFTHNIEEAIQFDSKFPDAKVTYANEQKTALEHYKTQIDEINLRTMEREMKISSIEKMKATEEKKSKPDAAKIAKLEKEINHQKAQLEYNKKIYNERLRELGEKVTKAHEAAKKAEIDKKNKPWYERAHNYMREHIGRH